MPQSSDLVSVLRVLNDRQAEKRAFTLLKNDRDEAAISFGKLHERARRIAAHLRRLAEPGERALLLFPSGIEFIEAFLGCLYARIIAVPAYPPEPASMKATLPRLRAIVSDCRPTLVLCDSDPVARRQALVQDAAELRDAQFCWPQSEVPAHADVLDDPLVDAETSAFLQYTSGSTALPKGVVVKHRNILANQEVMRVLCAPTSDSVCVTWLPLYHDMGLIGNVLHSLTMGMSCVLMSPMSFLQRPLTWLHAISRFGGTFSGGPNFSYELCTAKAQSLRDGELDLSRWKVAFNGAEPVRPDTLERFAAAFARFGFRRESFLPSYGLAENTLMATGTVRDPVIKHFDKIAYAASRAVEVDGDGDAIRLVSNGAADPSTRIEIVDPGTCERCAPGEIGEIWVSGPSVAAGYWGRAEESRATFEARAVGVDDAVFLRTGDLGFKLDGELYVSGRLKDLIIVRGRKVHPQDVETTVEGSHAGIRRGGVAAFGFESGGEERLGIVAALDLKHAAAAPSVLGDIRQRVTEVHQTQPFAIALVKPGSVSKTSSGKVQRGACRDLFLNRKLQIVAEWSPLPLASPSAVSALPR